MQPGTNRIRVPVGRDWGNGGYVVATLLRPLDAAAQRMPGRAIGVQWFAIDRKAKTLAVDLAAPALVRPSTTMRVPVQIDGLAGQEARLVVAAVDVGILNLTNYKPPAPDDYYLGQRRLAAEVRDLYGQLIDGMQATRGQIRSGGDASAELQGSPPTQAPVALYSGIVRVGADGRAEVAFDIPEFAGTVRLMAVAWSKDKVGHGTADVTVRDPVVLTATLPRFVLSGDRTAMQLDLDNVEGPAGDYRDLRAADGPVQLGATAPQTLRLGAHERNRLAVPLTASGTGIANLKVDVAGPGNFALQRSYALAAKPANRTLTRRTVRTIAAGESLTLSGDMFADLVPGTGSVAVSVGAVDGARRRDAAQGARPLSVRLLRADREPRAAAALRQRACGGVPARARHRRRPAHPRCDRPPAGAAGLERRVRPVVGRRRRRLARRLRDRLPDAGPRARLRRAGHRLQARARPACATSSPTPPNRRRTAAAISPTRSTCSPATASRRSATCATSPTPSSATSRRRSPRRRSPARSVSSATG